MKKLYEVEVDSEENIKDIFVVAKHETEAANKVEDFLIDCDCSFRYVKSVTLIAENYFDSPNRIILT